MSLGVPPIAIVFETSFVDGSILERVPSNGFTAHRKPEPKASESTPLATAIVRCVARRPGSIRQTEPVPSPTHTAPAPTAMSVKPSLAILIVAVTVFEAGETRTRPARGGACRPQRTPSGPAAISITEVGTLATTLPLCGSSRETVPSGLIAQIAPLPTTSESPWDGARHRSPGACSSRGR